MQLDTEANLVPVYVRNSISNKTIIIWKWVGIILLTLSLVSFVFIFVGIPVYFMHSIELQRCFIFTTFDLQTSEDYFKKFELLPGLRNYYVRVSDMRSGREIMLGVWQVLPYSEEENAISDVDIDFDKKLHDLDTIVLLYFHGTGEDRSSSLNKYQVLKQYFHVITFDYRNYGDSSKADLSEDAVVDDCIQLYKWLTSKTNASIVIWGHSLGSAIATHSIAKLSNDKNITQPIGLILESAFTSLTEELYANPYDICLVTMV